MPNELVVSFDTVAPEILIGDKSNAPTIFPNQHKLIHGDNILSYISKYIPEAGIMDLLGINP